MIKGINGYGYFDELVIPIIENTAWEHELSDSLGATIARYPKACAVLVRRHGMYVWGDSWEQAKRHGECLHYLFEVAINMRRLGMDFNSPPLPISCVDVDAEIVEERGRCLQKGCKHVVFDIEGTTTPITFVREVLFPFASNHVAKFLEESWESPQTVLYVSALREMAATTSDVLPSVEAPKAVLVDAIANFVKQSISLDRKDTALKQLQGAIWESGYNSNAIKSIVYDDVPACFARLKAAGVSISIYSSGSREAQRLLFKHSNHGDLRRFISCYFDTKVGHKRDAKSYQEIAASLGVDSPSEILFVTDIIEESQAATEAGLQTIISVRPGNAPLPLMHPFQSVTSFTSL